jgi:hypothetical protein
MLKYHSTPKPVRIRIESGGEEHFSLDSLLRCFNPGDLLGKRNELLRWLDFQGNEGKLISEELRTIEELCTIEDFHQNVFGVYRAFFHQFIDENHINRIEELYALWAKEKGRNFDFLKAFFYNDGIRILSGGEEHFSLESLLNCFNPKELVGKKEELLKWLDFQGEEGKPVSEELLKINDLSQEVFGLYKAFFHQFIKEHHIKKIEELYALWAKNKGKNFSYLKDFCYQDDFLIEKLFLNKQTKGFEKNWFRVISDFVAKNYLDKEDNEAVDIGMTFRKEIRNPNLLYHLGVLYYKDKDDISKAKICLEAALKKGSKMDIQKPLKEIEELLSRSRFYEIDKDKVSKYIDYLFKYWTYNWNDYNDMKSECDYKNRETHHIPLSDKEVEILDLVFSYKAALKYGPNKLEPTKGKRYREIESATNVSDSNDFLKKEKYFIKYLSRCEYDDDERLCKEGREGLKRISKEYVPAKYVLYNTYKNPILDNKPMLRIKPIPEIIEFVLRHIFDFE